MASSRFGCVCGTLLALSCGRLGAGLPPEPVEEPGTSEPEPPSPADSGVPGGPLQLELSFGELSPPFAPGIHEYELSTYSARGPMTLTVHGADAWLGAVGLVAGRPHALQPEALRPDSALDVAVAEGDGGTSRYVIRLWPRDFPSYSVQLEPSAAVEGELFLSPFSLAARRPYLLVVGASGEVRYYRRLREVAHDFKPHTLPGGEVRHSYVSEGRLHLLDADLRELSTQRVLATARHPEVAADEHDLLWLGEDHLLLMAYVDQKVTNIPPELPHPSSGARVVAAVVQEVKQGKVLFEWDSTEHPELYALSTEGRDFDNPALVGLGLHRPGEPDALELDGSGNKRFSLSFDATYFSYRAVRSAPRR